MKYIMKNKDGEEFRICGNCFIRHYENCTTCLGFGIMKFPKYDEIVPISAGEAAGGSEPLPEWKSCPECGSTPKGIDKAHTCANRSMNGRG